MFLRILIALLFMFFIGVQKAFCADLYIEDAIIDNSDKVILIRGTGNYKSDKTYTYTPNPESNSTKLINNITSFTMSNPYRFVLDIPNAALAGSSRNYKVTNSKTIQSVQLAQFSANPDIARVVVTLKSADLFTKFKVYSDGANIVLKYSDPVVDNSIQYKFYTTSGDMDKNATLQNTSAVVTYNNTGEELDLKPRLQTKYYLSQISQNSDGLILRGLGAVSYQRAVYNDDNTSAYLILDNADVAAKLENKSYNIPSSDRDIKATLTITKPTDKKVKLTLNGENLKDYRFVVSPDGQCLFISHRGYIINTIFSTNSAKIDSYSVSRTQTGYKIFDFVFNQSVTYDVFELGDNFYFDINNLGDYNEQAFEKFLKDSELNIQVIKISSDKTRFVIPASGLNFSYANVESNAKSIKLCFREKPAIQKPQTDPNEIIIVDNSSKNKPKENIKNVKDDEKVESTEILYIPKTDDKDKKEEKPQKPKRKKDTTF